MSSILTTIADYTHFRIAEKKMKKPLSELKKEVEALPPRV